MVALEQNFFAVERFDKAEIRARLLKMHRPRDVARDDDGVVGRDGFVPVLAQPLGMVFPNRTENIHRLAAAERKMQIADCKNRNKNHLLQTGINLHARDRL